MADLPVADAQLIRSSRQEYEALVREGSSKSSEACFRQVTVKKERPLRKMRTAMRLHRYCRPSCVLSVECIFSFDADEGLLVQAGVGTGTLDRAQVCSSLASPPIYA